MLPLVGTYVFFRRPEVLPLLTVLRVVRKKPNCHVDVRLCFCTLMGERTTSSEISADAAVQRCFTLESRYRLLKSQYSASNALPDT